MIGDESQQYILPQSEDYYDEDYYDTVEESKEEEPVNPLTKLLPLVKFDCIQVDIDGYYADVQFACKVFHYCQNGKRHTFMCPPKSWFNQRNMICDYDELANDDCESSIKYYNGAKKSSSRPAKVHHQIPAPPPSTTTPRPTVPTFYETISHTARDQQGTRPANKPRTQNWHQPNYKEASTGTNYHRLTTKATTNMPNKQLGYQLGNRVHVTRPVIRKPTTTKLPTYTNQGYEGDGYANFDLDDVYESLETNDALPNGYQSPKTEKTIDQAETSQRPKENGQNDFYKFEQDFIDFVNIKNKKTPIAVRRPPIRRPNHENTVRRRPVTNNFHFSPSYRQVPQLDPIPRYPQNIRRPITDARHRNQNNRGQTVHRDFHHRDQSQPPLFGRYTQNTQASNLFSNFKPPTFHSFRFPPFDSRQANQQTGGHRRSKRDLNEDHNVQRSARFYSPRVLGSQFGFRPILGTSRPLTENGGQFAFPEFNFVRPTVLESTKYSADTETVDDTRVASPQTQQTRFANIPTNFFRPSSPGFELASDRTRQSDRSEATEQVTSSPRHPSQQQQQIFTSFEPVISSDDSSSQFRNQPQRRRPGQVINEFSRVPEQSTRVRGSSPAFRLPPPRRNQNHSFRQRPSNRFNRPSPPLHQRNRRPTVFEPFEFDFSGRPTSSRSQSPLRNSRPTVFIPEPQLNFGRRPQAAFLGNVPFVEPVDTNRQPPTLFRPDEFNRPFIPRIQSTRRPPLVELPEDTRPHNSLQEEDEAGYDNLVPYFEKRRRPLIPSSGRPDEDQRRRPNFGNSNPFDSANYQEPFNRNPVTRHPSISNKNPNVFESSNPVKRPSEHRRVTTTPAPRPATVSTTRLRPRPTTTEASVAKFGQRFPTGQDGSSIRRRPGTTLRRRPQANRNIRRPQGHRRPTDESTTIEPAVETNKDRIRVQGHQEDQDSGRHSEDSIRRPDAPLEFQTPFNNFRPHPFEFTSQRPIDLNEGRFRGPPLTTDGRRPPPFRNFPSFTTEANRFTGEPEQIFRPGTGSPFEGSGHLIRRPGSVEVTGIPPRRRRPPSSLPPHFDLTTSNPEVVDFFPTSFYRPEEPEVTQRSPEPTPIRPTSKPVVRTTTEVIKSTERPSTTVKNPRTTTRPRNRFLKRRRNRHRARRTTTPAPSLEDVNKTRRPTRRRRTRYRSRLRSRQNSKATTTTTAPTRTHRPEKTFDAVKIDNEDAQQSTRHDDTTVTEEPKRTSSTEASLRVKNVETGGRIFNNKDEGGHRALNSNYRARLRQLAKMRLRSRLRKYRKKTSPLAVPTTATTTTNVEPKTTVPPFDYPTTEQVRKKLFNHFHQGYSMK